MQNMCECVQNTGIGPKKSAAVSFFGTGVVETKRGDKKKHCCHKPAMGHV
jgi:hypothetical protein